MIAHRIDLFWDQKIVTAIAEPKPIPLLITVLVVPVDDDCAKIEIELQTNIVNKKSFLYMVRLVILWIG